MLPWMKPCVGLISNSFSSEKGSSADAAFGSLDIWRAFAIDDRSAFSIQKYSK